MRFAGYQVISDPDEPRYVFCLRMCPDCLPVAARFAPARSVAFIGESDDSWSTSGRFSIVAD